MVKTVEREGCVGTRPLIAPATEDTAIDWHAILETLTEDTAIDWNAILRTRVKAGCREWRVRRHTTYHRPGHRRHRHRLACHPGDNGVLTPQLSPVWSPASDLLCSVTSRARAAKAGSMLGRRRRRRANIEPALVQCLALAVIGRADWAFTRVSHRVRDI